jgi:hypothetical protein
VGRRRWRAVIMTTVVGRKPSRQRPVTKSWQRVAAIVTANLSGGSRAG